MLDYLVQKGLMEVEEEVQTTVFQGLKVPPDPPDLLDHLVVLASVALIFYRRMVEIQKKVQPIKDTGDRILLPNMDSILNFVSTSSKCTKHFGYKSILLYSD